MKMPDPMMPLMTIIVASNRPSLRKSRGGSLTRSRYQSVERAGREGVTRPDVVDHAPPSPRRVERRVGGDGVGGGREVLVVDLVAEPARDVVVLDVVEPGRVVDALGELAEGHEVLRAQVELAARAAEVEAAIARELAARVLTLVALEAAPRLRRREALRCAAGRPEERLAVPDFGEPQSHKDHTGSQLFFGSGTPPPFVGPLSPLCLCGSPGGLRQELLEHDRDGAALSGA